MTIEHLVHKLLPLSIKTKKRKLLLSDKKRRLLSRQVRFLVFCTRANRRTTKSANQNTETSQKGLYSLELCDSEQCRINLPV